MITNFLVKAEQGAINSGKDVKYFTLHLELKEHTSPLYIQKCIKDKMKELGLEKTHFQKFTCSWNNIDSEIAQEQLIAADYKDKKSEYPAQYYGAIKRIDLLTETKKILESGVIVG